jgi:hypothetical protein
LEKRNKYPAYCLVGTICDRSKPPTDLQSFTTLLMTVIRLYEHQTDMVLTINVPFTKPETIRGEGILAAPACEISTPGEHGELAKAAFLIRDQALRSLKVCDWDLFSPED